MNSPETRYMRTIPLLLTLVLAHPVFASGSDIKVEVLSELLKVESAPRNGFHFPFFLYVPKNLAKAQRLLVIPNNSGNSQDTFEAQIDSAKRQTLVWNDLAERVSAVLLVPAFPRPNVEPPVYTHALSRSTLLVKDGDLKRIDLQLIKMIEAANLVLSKRGAKHIKRKVFLFGFSASASFVNRFTFIHPELVGAVAFGAPGGWPLAPLTEYKGKTLNYPVGLADFQEVSSTPFDLDALKRVPIFAFLGSKDENDSVTFRDSYTEVDQALVFSEFGKNPVGRWPIAEKFYKDAGLKATFKLYDGLAHGTNRAVHDDIVDFFLNSKAD